MTIHRLTGMKAGILLLGCLLLCGSVGADSGKLQSFEDHINPPPPTEDLPAKQHHHKRPEEPPSPEDDCSADTCTEGNFGELAALLILAGPFYIPRLATGDYGQKYHLQNFPNEKNVGMLSDVGKSWTIRTEAARFWSPHEPDAWKGGLSLYTTSRFGFDTSYTRYTENIKGGKDSLTFFDFIPTYDFARSEHWDWRVGLGYESIQGYDHHDLAKLTYGFKYFITKPIRFDTDLGIALAPNTTIFEMSPGLAYQWNRFEIKMAYERRSISGVTIEGPALSLAVWF